MPNRETSDDAHVIRLHGPWESQQCGLGNAECGIEPTPTRVKVPLNFSDWLDPDFRGTVVLERAFGLPTNLDEQQSVQLAVQTNQLSICSVSLNQTEIELNQTELNADLSGSTAAQTPGSNGDSNGQVLHRHDVTSLLTARNRLRLTLTVDATPKGELPYIAIEIFG